MVFYVIIISLTRLCHFPRSIEYKNKIYLPTIAKKSKFPDANLKWKCFREESLVVKEGASRIEDIPESIINKHCPQLTDSVSCDKGNKRRPVLHLELNLQRTLFLSKS